MNSPTITATSTHFLDALSRGNDEGAWAVLDERSTGPWCGFVTRMGLRPEDAADAAQQTMADVFGAIREGRYVREKGRLRTWIMTIARRRATDLLREAHRHGPGIADRTLDGDAAAGAHPAPAESVWAEEERRVILARALALLADDPGVGEVGKRVFDLVQVKGVPPSAAAEQCGVSVDQVYLMKHRMLKRCREIVSSLQDAYDADE